MTIHRVDCKPNWTEKKAPPYKTLLSILMLSFDFKRRKYLFCLLLCRLPNNFLLRRLCATIENSLISTYIHIYTNWLRNQAHTTSHQSITQCVWDTLFTLAVALALAPSLFAVSLFFLSSLLFSTLNANQKWTTFGFVYERFRSSVFKQCAHFEHPNTKLNRCVYTRWISLAVVCWFGLFWLENACLLLFLDNSLHLIMQN